MAKNKKIENTKNTAYDDVYRTLLNDCSSLIIPVVNEIFQKKYSQNERVILLNNELYLNRQNGKQVERITDSNFMIGLIRYHIECQSTEDGTMMLRIFEYDSQIALQDSELRENVLTVKFPNTAIIYLRHKKKMPDHMKIVIRVPEDTCSYNVPVLKIQKYTIDEIFEKNLYFLIPFHIFVYEKNFDELESNELKLLELKRTYEDIIKRLKDCVNQKIITEYMKSSIIDMSKKVLEQIARKYSNVKERVGDVMGGKILDYEAKDILNAGRKGLLLELIEKKVRKGKTVTEIAEELEEDKKVIETLIEELQIKSN